MNIATQSLIYYDPSRGLIVDNNPIDIDLGDPIRGEILTSTSADSYLKAIAPELFVSPKIGTLMETLVNSGDGNLTYSSDGIKIIIPETITTRINPGFTVNDVRTKGTSGVDAYLSAFGIAVRKVDLGLCVKPIMTSPNWFMTAFEGRFVTRDETDYSQVLTACLKYNLDTKFLDLSGFNYTYENFNCPINQEALLVILMEDGSLIYSDLTKGNNPDEGLITENMTITSNRVMKSITIYYDYKVS